MEIKLCEVCLLRQRPNDDLYFTLDGKTSRVCEKCWAEFTEMCEKTTGEKPAPGIDLNACDQNIREVMELREEAVLANTKFDRVFVYSGPDDLTKNTTVVFYFDHEERLELTWDEFKEMLRGTRQRKQR